MPTPIDHESAAVPLYNQPRSRLLRAPDFTIPLLAAFSWGLFAVLLAASRVATGIVVQADEGSYLLNAAAIAGKLQRSELLYDYYSGYSVLLAPAFLVAADFSSIYAIALGINALLVASIPFAFYFLIGTTFPDIDKRSRLLIAICASCYAPLLALSQYAMSDNALAAIYAWSMVAGALAIVRRRWIPAAACGALLGWLFVVHARGAALAIPVLLVFSLYAWQYHDSRIRVTVIWAFALLAGSMHSWIERMAGKYTGSAVPGSSLTSILSRFESPATWAQAALNAGGASVVAVVGSAGLAIIVLIAVCRMLSHRADSQPRIAPHAVVSIACLASLAGCICATAVFFTPPQRIDHVVYGRYLLPVMPVLVALGFACLQVRAARRTGDSIVAACAGILLISSMAIAFKALPHPEITNWNAVNSIELFVPYKAAGLRIDWLLICLWFVLLWFLTQALSHRSMTAAMLSFALLNFSVAGYMFVSDTVYARDYYARDRSIIAKAAEFMRWSGTPLCISIYPSLSDWHKIDFKSRLYDQLPSSTGPNRTSCIPALIASARPAVERPPNMVPMATESTSPSGPFPVVLFVRSDPKVLAFLRDHPSP